MGRLHPQDKYRALSRRVGEIPDVDICISCEMKVATSIAAPQVSSRTRFSDSSGSSDKLNNGFRVRADGGITLAEHSLGELFSDHIRETKGLFSNAAQGVFVEGRKTPLRAEGLRVHSQVRAIFEPEGNRECDAFRNLITPSVKRASKIYSHRVLNRIIQSKDAVVLFFLAVAHTSEKEDSEISFVDDYLISALRYIERTLSISHNRYIDTLDRDSSRKGVNGPVVGSRLVMCDGTPGFLYPSRMIIGDILFALLSGHASTADEIKTVRSAFRDTGSVGGFFSPVPVDRSTERSADAMYRDMVGESYVLLVAALGAMGPRQAIDFLPLLSSGGAIKVSRWKEFLHNVASSPDLPLELLYGMQREDPE